MLRSCEDTIAAVSSATGHAARGIVRVSGPQAVALAEGVFGCADGHPVEDLPGHVRRFGQLRIEPGGPTVPAELYVFRAPRSYTGQDLIELHTVGSPVLLSMVLEMLLAGGARPAEPGEFTARAFLAGKLDLAQAEGVAATVASQSDAQLQAATRLLSGALSTQTQSICDDLTDLLSLVEAEIDFSDEPIEFIRPADVARRIEHLRSRLRALLDTSVAIEALDVLPSVMLTGPVNVGKSSLLNRLTGLDRAICSPLAGTTRDVLTAPWQLPGGGVLLVDAAGLAARPEAELEQLADQAARRAAEQANLLLLVVDLADAAFLERVQLLADLPERPRLVVANKTDLLDESELARRTTLLARQTGRTVVAVSAVTGQGCDDLVRAVGEMLHGQLADVSGQVVAVNARHREALQAAAAAVARARDLCDAPGEVLDRAELLAVELREAVDQVGTIVGQVVTEDLLDRIFANFCIGK